MSSSVIAVVGATGLIGFPIAKAVLSLGHSLIAISRGKTETNAKKLELLEQLGAKLVFCSLDDYFFVN
jgi:predicted amino acid dehydrogenase